MNTRLQCGCNILSVAIIWCNIALQLLVYSPPTSCDASGKPPRITSLPISAKTCIGDELKGVWSNTQIFHNVVSAYATS